MLLLSILDMQIDTELVASQQREYSLITKFNCILERIFFLFVVHICYLLPGASELLLQIAMNNKLFCEILNTQNRNHKNEMIKARSAGHWGVA